MQRFFISIISVLLVCLTWNQSFAAQVSAPLSVSQVKVTDNKHIRIIFSEAIDSDSIVLKVTKQSDNSSIKLDSIKALEDDKLSVEVVLDDVLVEASSYTLTVIAGIGISGATITDGASALQDFITPSPLKIAGEEVLNAPSNPNAVLTDTPKTPVKTTVETDTEEVAGEETMPTPTDELPLTGPNVIFFLGLSIFLAYIFLRRKSLTNQ